MHRSSITAGLAALALGLVGLSPGTAAGKPGDPGVQGSPLTLAVDVDLKGYDVAYTPDGTAYVGWIGSPANVANRQVHLCVLTLGATECLGGIQSTSAGTGGANSAGGLRVLTNGSQVELVWFHDTPDSINGPFNARISSAAVVGDFLSGAVTESDAPSFGSMLTAEPGPAGLWTVSQAISGEDLFVRRGDGSPADNVPTPWRVGSAKLAFDGPTPIVVFDKFGDIDEPLRVTRFVHGSWSTPAKVPGTWSVGGAFDIETAANGKVYLVSSVNNASYKPQIAVWEGSKFGKQRLTGNNASCQASTHDLVTDPSGRLTDVSRQCSDFAIANHAKRGVSAISRDRFGGTPLGGQGPQIASLASGRGRVVFARSTSQGDRLLTQEVRLPALPTRDSASRNGNRVTLRGPVSCMPTSRTTVSVSGDPARGWRVVSKSLTLDGKAQGATLVGGSLDSGESYRLAGRVTFGKGNQRASVTASISFEACPAP